MYAVDLKFLPEAVRLMNKLVKIECSGKKITISEISEKEAEKFWAARVMKVDIPEPDITVDSIVDLNKADPWQGTRYIGAKASNYAIIRQLLPEYVRQGYAIPFARYFKTVQSCGADTLIDILLKQKPKGDEKNNQLKKIRETILKARIDPHLIKEIKELQTSRFENFRIRLRSSTNCEDLPEFNGAGLYISKGYDYNDGDEKLEKMILQVYASLWSEIAFDEREFYFIDHSKVGMGILINRAFTSEYANGVVLTSEENGNISVYMNTQFGENSVTNPENGQIPESLLFRSALNDDYETESRSNIHDVFLQDELKEKLIELKSVVLKIHNGLTHGLKNDETNKFGVDVEFKLTLESGEYKLFIKQARLLKIIVPN